MLKQCQISTSTHLHVTSKPMILLFLQNCTSMEELKQIHACIFTAGLCQDHQTLNKLMAFCTDQLMGCLKYANRVFDCMRTPSLFAYNLMAKSYTKMGHFNRAMFLFEQLREHGLQSDSFTYPYILKSVGCSGDLMGALMLHVFAMKTGMVFDKYVCNSFIDAYARLDRVHSARKLFDEMPERDTVSWNVLISGLVRCKMFKDAVVIFQRMLRGESDLRPDEATIVSALSACVALKSLELVREIHCYVEDQLYLTPNISNALVDMYCKCGCLGTAREIFEMMPTKNMVSWTSMITGYINSGELDEATTLFDSSPEKDVVLWTAMINGCLQLNRYDPALRLFHDMQLRRIKPDSFTLVTLLTGCIKMGAHDMGKQLHNYITENKIMIDVVLGTALIEVYAKCGCIDKSLEIFSILQDKDKTSWTSIICGLAMNGRTNHALKLFAEMQEAGPRPDHVTFIGVLSACCHGGLVDEGRKQFNLMRDVYQIDPTVEHYTCMVDLLGRAGQLEEAADLIREVTSKSASNTDVVAPLFSSLLRACRTHGTVEMGEKVVEWLVEMGSNDPSVGMLLSNIYADVERWEDATNTRGSLRIYRGQTQPGYSSIEVLECFFPISTEGIINISASK